MGMRGIRKNHSIMGWRVEKTVERIWVIVERVLMSEESENVFKFDYGIKSCSMIPQSN